MNITPDNNSAQRTYADTEANPQANQNESHVSKVVRATAIYLHGTTSADSSGVNSVERRAAIAALIPPSHQHFDPGFRERATASHERSAASPLDDLGYFDPGFIERATARIPWNIMVLTSHQPPSEPTPPLPDYKLILEVMPWFAQGLQLDPFSNRIGTDLSVYFTPEGAYTEQGQLFCNALNFEEQATLNKAVEMRQNSLSRMVTAFQNHAHQTDSQHSHHGESSHSMHPQKRSKRLP